MDRVFNSLTESISIDKIHRNESMKKHTSFKIGGPADILVEPTNIEEILSIVKSTNKFKCPLFVMGNGSNLLVKDKGIRGVVMKLSEKFSDIRIDEEYIHAESGILMTDLTKISVLNNLTGLEYAIGIPGTLGGAITMNAGAYGGEIKNSVISVKAVNLKGDIKKYYNDELEFGYRTSLFQKEKLIITSINMKLEHGNRLDSEKLIDDYTIRRNEKQPMSQPSAGSTFKRPVGYYAGKLIQDAGLMGMRVGDAKISKLHAGFIINLGNASADDVINLINQVQNKIYNKYGVRMEPEVRVVGE